MKNIFLEIIYMLITIVYSVFLVVEKVSNGRSVEPENGPVADLAFIVGIIAFILVIIKRCMIDKKKKQENTITNNDYNELLIFSIILQESITVVAATLIICFHMNLTDKEWIFHTKYIGVILYFIIQMIIYFTSYKSKIKKNEFTIKNINDYTIISLALVPVLVITRFILGN